MWRIVSKKEEGVNQPELLRQYYAIMERKIKDALQSQGIAVLQKDHLLILDDNKQNADQDLVRLAKEACRILNDSKRDWHKVYQAELLLPRLLKDEQLKTEIECIKGDLREGFPKSKMVQLDELHGKSTTEEQQRAFLFKLISEKQWAQLRKEEIWRLHKGLFSKLFMRVFLLLTTGFLSYWGMVWGSKYWVGTIVAIPANSFATLVFGIPLVMSLGALGATFSLLIRTQKATKSSRLRDMTLFAQTSHLRARTTIGALAALTGYIFYRLEIITFPHVSGDATALGYDILAIGLILGFSEALIPTFIEKYGSKVVAVEEEK